MNVILSLLLGALIGWIGSLAMRSPTSERILTEIAIGAIAALGLALLLGGSSPLDSMVAALIASLVAMIALHGLRLGLSR